MKDKNGVEIKEGDRIWVSRGAYMITSVVIKKRGKLCAFDGRKLPSGKDIEVRVSAHNSK